MRVLFAAAGLAAAVSPVRAADAFDATVKPFLAAYCVECHGEKTSKGDLRLDTLTPGLADAEARATWKAVLDRVRAGEMPPAKRPRPPKHDLDAAAGWIAGELAAVERRRQATEGRAVLRRLNRAEYENTVRDLMGVPVDVADLLPEDTLSHGFDTVGAALAVSPVHLERYLSAARKALDAGLMTAPKPEVKATKHALFEGAFSVAEIGKKHLKRADGSLVMFTAGRFGSPMPVAENFRAPVAGWYRVRVRGAAYQSPSPVEFVLSSASGGFNVDTRPIMCDEFPPGAPKDFEGRAWLPRGHKLVLRADGLTLPGYRDDTKNQGPVDAYPGPGVAVHEIEVEGPLYDAWPPRGQQLLFGAEAKPARGQETNRSARWAFPSNDPKADAARLLPGFLSAAFRRPATAEKAAPYLALFESQLASGSSYEEAMRAAATAALCSPDFLFLVETPGRLDDFALAARLSYFLTRSAPDGELLGLTAAGKLTDPGVLRVQTDRLLALPAAARFHADFTDGWLDLRNLAATTPDRLLYPEFDARLERAIPQETRRFFAAVLDDDLPATAFVDSDFSILNERLARHYGIPGVRGVAFRRVPLKPEYHRGGVLTHAGVLKVSANGTGTSPVVRGVYVLERFLGQTPPPPPPGIPAVEPDVRGATSVRELLAKHRSDDTCASCHRAIDPPGFALESFDVIGGWRNQFRVLPEKGPRKYAPGPAVDASGEWPDGTIFAGFEEFRRQLLAEPGQFVRCLTKKLIAFGTGHEAGIADAPVIDDIVAASAKNGYGFRELIHAVVQSDLFRNK